MVGTGAIIAAARRIPTIMTMANGLDLYGEGNDLGSEHIDAALGEGACGVAELALEPVAAKSIATIAVNDHFSVVYAGKDQYDDPMPRGIRPEVRDGIVRQEFYYGLGTTDKCKKAGRPVWWRLPRNLSRAGGPHAGTETDVPTPD